MGPHEDTKRMLETSEERRNRRVDALLEDPAVKAAVRRDQRRQATEEELEASLRKSA